MLAAPKMEAAGCLNSVQHNGETAFTLRLLYNGPTPGRRESVEKAQKPRLTSVEPVSRGVQAPVQTIPFAVRHVKVNVGMRVAVKVCEMADKAVALRGGGTKTLRAMGEGGYFSGGTQGLWYGGFWKKMGICPCLRWKAFAEWGIVGACTMAFATASTARPPWQCIHHPNRES